MKKLTLIYLLMAAAMFCRGQANKADCDKFQTGIFTYKEEQFNTVIVTRTEQEQKEVDKKSGLKIKYKIRWTGDCTYELIQTWSNNKKINKNKGSVIKVKMTKVFADSYEYIADCDGNITKYTVVRIKK